MTAGGSFCAADRGIVPWDRSLGLFRSIGFDGPIILQSLDEGEANRTIAFMRDQIARASDAASG